MIDAADFLVFAIHSQVTNWPDIGELIVRLAKVAHECCVSRMTPSSHDSRRYLFRLLAHEPILRQGSLCIRVWLKPIIAPKVMITTEKRFCSTRLVTAGRKGPRYSLDALGKAFGWPANSVRHHHIVSYITLLLKRLRTCKSKSHVPSCFL